MRAFALLLALAVLIPAQGPAPINVFRRARPGYPWRFPADDFAHPGFANEWWYFTGNLSSPSGRRFGFELTFFRIAPAPGADLRQAVYFTHFAVTDISGRRYLSHERPRRGDWLQAGVVRTPVGFRLWNENWTADFDATGPRHLHAVWDGESIDLALTPGARMLNGDRGYSQKGDDPGQASYYYSFPRIAAAGAVQSVAVSGAVWMDHEFASSQLAANQQGWDWMGLHLPDADLLLFNLRRANGARDPHSAGALRPLGAASVPLRPADFQMTPTRWWRGYPVAWRVRVPQRQLDLAVAAALDDQEFHAPSIGVNYWEGAVVVAGTRAGRPIHGNGYLELTGYGKRFNLLQ